MSGRYSSTTPHHTTKNRGAAERGPGGGGGHGWTPWEKIGEWAESCIVLFAIRHDEGSGGRKGVGCMNGCPFWCVAALPPKRGSAKGRERERKRGRDGGNRQAGGERTR